jgi:hypothetical protein
MYQGYTLKRRHPYVFVKDGEEIRPPGVTTITGQFGKDAIMQWAANLAAQTAVELYGSLPNEEVYEKARKKHIEVKTDAGAGGTEGHAWIEAYLKDELGDSYYFESEYGINFVEAFLEFEKEYEFTTHQPEKILLSLDFFYAGTRDDLAIKDNQNWTLDFKTGNPDFEYDERNRRYTGRARPYSTHLMQCAGYDLAEQEMNGISSENYGVLYLVKNPKELAKKYGINEKRYFFFPTDNTSFWQVEFLNARKLYDIDINNPYKEVL